MGLKYKMLRLYVKTKRKLSKVKDKIDSKPGITELQRKSMKLWLKSLKDKDGKMYSCFPSSSRQIERNKVLVMLNPHGDHYYITIIHNNKGNCFEISIPTDLALELASHFDVEMERRMRALEFNKREVINKDLDALIGE